MANTITIGTDPASSLVTGRNGTFPLAALNIWYGSRGQMFIDGVGRSGKVLRAGFMIDHDAAVALCKALASEITS